jgi:ribonuclease P protein component
MLSKSHRLPAPDITRVLHGGKRVGNEFFQLITAKNEMDVSRFIPRLASSSAGTPLGCSRFAFIVSTKVDKRATVRNRVKRLMSESIRHLGSTVKAGFDCIVVARKESVGADQGEIEKRVTELLKRADVC